MPRRRTRSKLERARTSAKIPATRAFLCSAGRGILHSKPLPCLVLYASFNEYRTKHRLNKYRKKCRRTARLGLAPQFAYIASYCGCSCCSLLLSLRAPIIEFILLTEGIVEDANKGSSVERVVDTFEGCICCVVPATR